jgi:4-hydroxyphenylpyruvate dioxygenase-like putative hemolysin
MDAQHSKDMQLDAITAAEQSEVKEAGCLPLWRNVIGIDHIAVAVPDLKAAVEWAHTQLGCDIVEERETNGAFSGMKSAVLRLGGFILVFVQGTGSDSQVTQFVRKHGPGVQHIALRVHDLGQTKSVLEVNQMTFSTPRLDSNMMSQVFSERDLSSGLMIEFVERRDGYEGFSDENVQRLFSSLEEKGLY